MFVETPVVSFGVGRESQEKRAEELCFVISLQVKEGKVAEGAFNLTIIFLWMHHLLSSKLYVQIVIPTWKIAKRNKFNQSGFVILLYILVWIG